MRRAGVAGTAVVVLCLLLLPGSGVPIVPGRPPSTPDPDQAASRPGGPTADLDTLILHLPAVTSAAGGPSAPVDPEGFGSGEDLGLAARLESPVSLGADGLDAIRRLDDDDGGVLGGMDTAFASALLVLVMLQAAGHQGRHGRRDAVTPSPAAGPAIPDRRVRTSS